MGRRAGSKPILVSPTGGQRRRVTGREATQKVTLLAPMSLCVRLPKPKQLSRFGRDIDVNLRLKHI